MRLPPALLACGGTEEPEAPPTYYADLAKLTQQLDTAGADVELCVGTFAPPGTS